MILQLGTIDHHLMRREAEVIGLLFWYAVQRERCGDADLFDAILNLAKRELDEWRSHERLWHLSASKMFAYASPRAAILAGPYIHWGQGRSVDAEDLISRWVAAISAVPYTEEVSESVVDTLLRIAANCDLRPFIPPDIWLWLNERPSLPPACQGLLSGSDCGVFRTVRRLNDIGVLTSYLVLVWSEWKSLDPDSFDEMRTAVREDFSGIGMSCQRAELIQRLDYILGELDQGSGSYPQAVKDQYGELKRILQEVDQETTEILNGMSHSFTFPSPLILMDVHRISFRLHVFYASPMSITSHLGQSTLCETNRFVYYRFISLFPRPPSIWHSWNSV